MRVNRHSISGAMRCRGGEKNRQPMSGLRSRMLNVRELMMLVGALVSGRATEIAFCTAAY